MHMLNLARDMDDERMGLYPTPPDPDYNFEHFRTRHFLQDLAGTLEARGVAPGALAPDFGLPLVSGGIVRLSELRDKPVLLHFGSVT